MAKAKARGGRRRPAKRAAPGTKTKAGPGSRPPQRVAVSHYREEDFRVNGLRAYAKYRDLGLNEATHGMVQAHVIRLLPPFRAEEVSKRHYHDVDFQMVYVLKGWIKTELAGQGAIVMKAGSCWTQPPRIEHTVLGYSDDCEVLEIVLPANFRTVELE
jgi:Cupin domain